MIKRLLVIWVRLFLVLLVLALVCLFYGFCFRGGWVFLMALLIACLLFFDLLGAL